MHGKPWNVSANDFLGSSATRILYSVRRRCWDSLSRPVGFTLTFVLCLSKSPTTAARNELHLGYGQFQC